MTHRRCDGTACVICDGEVTCNDVACVVAVPSRRLKKFGDKTKEQLRIKWNINDSTAVFHWNCWESTVTRVEGGTSKNDKVERNLIYEVLDTLEKFDTIVAIRQQAKQIASLLASSSHTVVFTGAGVSASSGIPTYRGADGIDTQAYVGNVPNKKSKIDSTTTEEEQEDFAYSKLQPTLTHRALASLHATKHVHYCITQNCDDLHAKAGFPRSALSELHGNVYCEYCEVCLAEYFRDYEVDAWSTDCRNESWFVTCPACQWNHYTSRKCSKRKCRGKLRDTIVNFGDDLHASVLGGLPAAQEQCSKADVCICLGSSLTVTPANELPRMAKTLIICNLQETELDKHASIRVWAACDLLFSYLMEEMN